MRRYGLDWGRRDGVEVHDPSSELDRTYPTLKALLSALPEASVLIIESTFGSFDLGEREMFENACSAAGHELYVTPPRMTERTRRKLHLKKSNLIDAEVIFHLGSTSAARRLVPRDASRVERRQRANHVLMELRRTFADYNTRLFYGVGKPDYRKAKDVFGRHLREKLPPFRYLQGPALYVAGKSEGGKPPKDYNLVILAAVGAAALFSRNRREWECIAGLSANGYPSQIRADLYHWGWHGGNGKANRLREIGRFEKEDGSTQPIYGGRKDGKTLSQWRRSLRHLYGLVKPIAHEAYVKTVRKFPGSSLPDPGDIP